MSFDLSGMYKCSFVSHFLFLFHLNSHRMIRNKIKLIFPLLLVFWSFLFLFLCCECGETVTNQYQMYDEKLILCNWYLLPKEIQRLLVVVIANSQQTVTICGFANTMCTRDIFKKVSEKMMFIWEKRASKREELGPTMNSISFPLFLHSFFLFRH